MLPDHLPGNPLAILRVNGIQEGVAVVVEALAGVTPNFLVGRADVMHRGVRGILYPEDLLEVGHQFPKLLFAFA